MLTPNATYEINGVIIKEKIIPDGLRWKSDSKAIAAGFEPGALYKKNALICGTGKPKFFTVHNTVNVAGNVDGGEQYTRATYNENMNSARVHFYCDELCAWQDLKVGLGLCSNDPIGSCEVAWHAGDGSSKAGGNSTSISMEIIMSGNGSDDDKKAYDNGARIAAYCMKAHGIPMENLVTHTYWVNKLNGKTFADPDEQSCNRIAGHKWCPSYILNSTNKTTAMANWKAFKATVKKYMNEMDDVKPVVEEVLDVKEEDMKSDVTYYPDPDIKVGDAVTLKEDAVYYSGKAMPAWVKAKAWIVRQINGERVVIDKSTDGKNSICSPVDIRYLVNTKMIEVKKEPEVIQVIESEVPDPEIKVGDIVYINSTATKWYSGSSIPAWVKAKKWIVRSVSGNRVVIDKSEDGKNSICSPIDIANIINTRTITVKTEITSVEDTATTDKEDVDNQIDVGDIVSIKDGALYYSGKAIPSWVIVKRWIVRQINGDRVIIDKSEDGKNAICSPVHMEDLILYRNA